LDLLNPSTMPQQESFVQTPSSFKGSLKSYQIRGLNWLLNLYDQGINGILADEMGLGKTVQSIAFLSYLAGSKDIWGPFLVVAPNSTLHQWQQEVSKFAPDLRILPYWGAAKERQILRAAWSSKALGTRDAPFHVLITSYNAVVADEKYFHRMRFRVMVLDEAQAIKNAASLRWKCLLNLKCRNRVLLTGTPIQNSMNELWALLHFSMPELFESREEFSDWFGRDVEDAATEGARLDQRQLQRLHMILKPFMLRRVKRDVENEMPPKIEVTLPCKLSATQRRIYKLLQQKIYLAHALETASAASKRSFLATLSGPSAGLGATDPAAPDSLVTLVMQFRKVCNHPELYEKKRVLSPFYFGHQIFYPLSKQKAGSGGAGATAGAAGEGKGKEGTTTTAASALNAKKKTPLLLLRCPAATLTANPIAPRLPSLLHRAIRVPSRDKLLNHSMSLFTAAHLQSALRGDGGTGSWDSSLGFLALLDASPLEIEFFVGADWLHAWFVQQVWMHRATQARLAPDSYRHRLRIDVAPVHRLAGSLGLVQDAQPTLSPLAQPSFTNSFELAGDGLVWRDPSQFVPCVSLLRRLRRLTRPRVVAAPAFPLWSRPLSSPASSLDALASDHTGFEKSVLLGVDCWKWSTMSMLRNHSGLAYPVSLQQSLDLLPVGLASMHRRTYIASPYTEQQALARWMATQNGAAAGVPPPLLHNPSLPAHLLSRTLHASSVCGATLLPGLMSSLTPLGLSPASRLLVPTVEDLIADSGKLQVLDSLLDRLKAEGHRVLIFSQMTKLIDLLEHFLRYRRHKYSRLDGQTALSSRRDLVKAFQTDSSIFAFLLSTRAGGLGINLTSADTVIFFDNDWNPSCDEQAMDRVHRIGQQRQVTVYRLVCSNTVEERILIRAQQKHAIQSTVYAGGFKMMNEPSAADAAAAAQMTGANSDKLEIQHLFSESELQSMLQPEDDAAAAAVPDFSALQPRAPAVKPPRASPSPPATALTNRAAKHRLEEEGKEESALKRQRPNGETKQPAQLPAHA